MSANITNAPVHYEIDGKDYLLTAFTHKDEQEFIRWTQDEYIALVKRGIVDITDENMKGSILLTAFNKAFTFEWISIDVIKKRATIPGITFLTYLALHKNQPDMTLDKTKELINNRENILIDILEKLVDINTVDNLKKSIDQESQILGKTNMKKKRSIVTYLKNMVSHLWKSQK